MANQIQIKRTTGTGIPPDGTLEPGELGVILGYDPAILFVGDDNSDTVRIGPLVHSDTTPVSPREGTIWVKTAAPYELSIRYQGEWLIINGASADSVFTGSADDGKSPMLNASGYLDETFLDPATKNVKMKTETGTSRTLNLTDASYYIRCTNASPVTLSVPTNAGYAFDIGANITIMQAGAGQVTINPLSFTVVNTATGNYTIASQFGVVSLVKVGTDEWDLMGDLTV